MEKGWYLGFNIIESMYFYPSLIMPVLGPTKDIQAEFNNRRIKRIDVPIQVEYSRNSQSTSLFHHIMGILFKDMIIPVLVRFCQVASAH